MGPAPRPWLRLLGLVPLLLLAGRGDAGSNDVRTMSTKEGAQVNCRQGTECQPDPNSCMGRGTNTLWGYMVQGAPENEWNGMYSPGDPFEYLDNVLRYDKDGNKNGGHSLYRANSQWRVGHIDNNGYAQGPISPWPDSNAWLRYGSEFKFPAMTVSRTIIPPTQRPAWREGVACVETESALSFFFQRADREHKWVVAALWRPDCSDCDWMWGTMAAAEPEHKEDTFFMAVDVDRCYKFQQNQPILGELPAFLIFAEDFERKVILSTPDFNDVLRCLEARKAGMQCNREVQHGDVWEQDNHNDIVNTLNAEYAQYTPNLVQDVGYSLAGYDVANLQLGAGVASDATLDRAVAAAAADAPAPAAAAGSRGRGADGLGGKLRGLHARLALFANTSVPPERRIAFSDRVRNVLFPPTTHNGSVGAAVIGGSGESGGAVGGAGSIGAGSSGGGVGSLVAAPAAAPNSTVGGALQWGSSGGGGQEGHNQTNGSTPGPRALLHTMLVAFEAMGAVRIEGGPGRVVGSGGSGGSRRASPGAAALLPAVGPERLPGRRRAATI